MTDKEHLPPITAALVVTTLSLEAEREIVGWERCRDALVGKMRRELGLIRDDQIIASASEDARNTSRLLLSELCRVCPHDHCHMKVW